MTNEQKRQKTLEESRRKQSIENAKVKELAIKLEQEIYDELEQDEIIFIYHVSHLLKRYGVPHFRSYDKSKFNGITVAIVSTGGQDNPVKIYAAFCDKEDTYSRSFGRLKVLTRIQKDIENKKNGITESKFNPVILDREQAFKYIDPLDGLTDSHDILRATIDWFITNHVNKPSKKQKAVNFTRQQVLQAERAVAQRAETELNNIADLRVVYEHQQARYGISKMPRLLRRIKTGGKEPRDATTAKFALMDTEKNRNLPEDVVAALKEVFNDTACKVYRHEDDQPNRVNARMFALRKLKNTAF